MKRGTLLLFLLSLLISVPGYSDGYAVPQRTDHNLIVASYNIKWFKMADQDLGKLAQVVSHFDGCGIVEVKDEKAVKDLVIAMQPSGVRTACSLGTALSARYGIQTKATVMIPMPYHFHQGTLILRYCWSIHAGPMIRTERAPGKLPILRNLQTRYSAFCRSRTLSLPAISTTPVMRRP